MSSSALLLSSSSNNIIMNPSSSNNNNNNNNESSITITTDITKKQLDDTRSLYLRGKEEFNNKKYDSACLTFNQVAKLQEGLLGKYHKETVTTYWLLGKCYCYSGSSSSSPQKALIAFQRSLRNANATNSAALGNDKTSMMLLRQDIESCWELCFPNLPNAINDMYTIFIAEQNGDTYYKSQNYKSALQCYMNALDIQSSLFKFALLFEQSDNSNENGSYTSNSSLESSYTSLDAADIRMKLGQCYIQMGSISKLSEAEKVLSKSYEDYIKLVGKDHPATYSSIASIRKLKTLRSGRSLGGMFSSKFGWLKQSSSLSSLGGGSSTRSTSTNDGGSNNTDGPTNNTTTTTPTSTSTTTSPNDNIMAALSASSE